MKFYSFRGALAAFACFIIGGLQAGELPEAPNDTFSIVVIPDTQHYHGKETKSSPDSAEPLTNAVFDGWTNWIAANLQRQRIVFVSHVGDIVDRNTRDQWELVQRYMGRLHGKIPYGLSVGNHDMTSSGDSSLFQEIFPKSRFKDFGWYAGCFENPSGNPAISGNNANSAQLFEAGGMKFVFLHLECNAPDDVLAWADSVFEEHADRRAIVTTHMDIGPRDKPKDSRDYYEAPKGRMTWKKRHGDRGNTSQQMWEKCFRNHANLFMICSGDQSRTQALRMKTTGENGNVVHSLLSDYGAGGLRVMQFQPAKNQVEVHTWDPLNGELCESTKIVPDRDQHQFTIPYEMTP